MPSSEPRTTSALEDLSNDDAIVVNVILSRSNKMFSSPDGPPIFALKQISDDVCYPFLLLFISSLKTFSVPCPLKTTIVTSLRPHATEISNYRPNSLLSSMCKVVELVVWGSLCSHFIRNDLISSHQFDFFKKSAAFQVLSRCNDWILALSDRTPIDILYVDYARAFDIVCHEKLLFQLSPYGAMGNLLDCICCFLIGWTLRTEVGEFLSQSHDIGSGICRVA